MTLPHVVIPPHPPERRLGDRVLRLGASRGQDVAWLQQRLGVVPADGWYGPVTMAALVAFQVEAGILADGIVGPTTWRKLGLVEPAAPVVFAAPLAVDGFTPRVERALRAVGAMEPSAWAAVLAPDMQRHEIITNARIAGFLSNVTHETGGLTRLVENLHYSSAERIMAVWPSRFPTRDSALPFVANGPALAERVYGGRMGNTEAGDGWRHRGRGGYQTTGRHNYTALSRATGEALDLLTGEASPLLTRAGASRSACLFWSSITGNRLADAGTEADLTELRRRGNGGRIGLEDVLKRDAKIRAALG
jgi:putative chitinase